jgi:flagella basal body P-ring formation protein FlgA
MEPDLQQELVAYVTEQCEATAVEVTWLGLDLARLPPGAQQVRWEGDPCRAHPQLQLTWATGAEVDRYTVRPELVVWVRALVAAEGAAQGELVKVTWGSAPLEKLTGPRWTSESAVALRPLAAGEALTAAKVALPADAVAGARVTVRVRSGDLEIRTEGRLIGAARVGQRVGVHLYATGNVARGVLVAPDTVEL